jgi:hypothetical protein
MGDAREDLSAALRVHLALGQPRGPLKALSDGLRQDEPDDVLARQLLALDDDLPVAALRARFRRELITEEDVLGYARFIATAPPTADRAERLELLLTRLLTRELSDGQLELLPEQDFVRTLAAVVGARTTDDETRGRAIAFFTDAAQRLSAMKGVQDLFSSGLHVQLHAFRTDLGGARLDPAVLYASLLLDVALANHIARLGGGRKTLAAEESEEAAVRRRLGGALAAVETYRALGLDDRRLADAAAEADAIGDQLERRGVDATVKGRTGRLVELVLSIDDDMEGAWFRTVLTTGAASTESLARYAAFLVGQEGEAPRRQRIEAVALQLLTRRSRSGELEVIDEKDVVALLARISPHPLADDAQRGAAAAFFLDAAHKLGGLESFDALFDDGLYLNLLGYRRALRWAGLDPGILYASILLDVAITNRMLRHLRAEQAPAERWLARAAEEERKVAAIFADAEVLESSDVADFETQLDRYIEVLRNLDGSITLPSGDRTFSREERDQLKKRALRNAAAVALAAALLFGAVQLAFHGENELKGLSPERLHALSSYLSEGQLSEGEARVLLAEIDKDRWEHATPKERKRAAKRLAKRLANIDVTGAIVTLKERPVIQIEGGVVVFVQ